MGFKSNRYMLAKALAATANYDPEAGRSPFGARPAFHPQYAMLKPTWADMTQML